MHADFCQRANNGKLIKKQQYMTLTGWSVSFDRSVDWAVCVVSDGQYPNQYAGPAEGRIMDTVEYSLNGGEGWVCSAWPETAKWPVCDPHNILSHGLLVRELVFYWAGTDTDWHACTMQLRLIIVDRGCSQCDRPNTFSSVIHLLTT